MKFFTIQKSELTEDLKNKIFNGLSDHAITQTGVDDLKPPLAFISIDTSGILMGAIVVQPFWGALHIKQLYVAEHARGSGLGTALMEQAFSFGKFHKHAFAFVETMSFQALEFYQKMGFYLEYTRTGYSHNASAHYLRKDL